MEFTLKYDLSANTSTDKTLFQTLAVVSVWISYNCNLYSFNPDGILGINTTIIPAFHSHTEALWRLNPLKIHKQVSLVVN